MRHDVGSRDVLGPLVRLAFPLAVGSGLNLINLVVDRLWIGSLGTVSLAGLGVAQAALMLLATLGLGLGMGTLTHVSQSVGADRRESAASHAVQGLRLAFLLGLSLACVALFWPGWLAGALRLDPETTGPATAYLQICQVGFIAHAPLLVVIFCLQGAGAGRAALQVSAVSPLLNLLLDPLLIKVGNLGLVGAGWATVGGNAVALLVGLHILHQHLPLTRGLGPRGAWQPILSVGVPATLEHLVRNVAGLALVAFLAPFGVKVISGYTASMVVLLVLITPGLALGQATASLVGQRLGARQPLEAWRVAWSGAGLYVSFMTVAGAVVFLAAEPLIACFDSSPAVVAEGSTFLRTFSLAFPGLALSLVLGKALIAARRARSALLSATVAHLLVQLPLVWLLSRHHGSQGAYVGMTLAFTVQGGLSALLFFLACRPTPSALPQPYHRGAWARLLNWRLA